MAAYLAGQALVEVDENVAPLNSHPASFDDVGDFPELVIPLVANFFQKFY